MTRIQRQARQILEAAGFREARTSGRHPVWRHPSGAQVTVPVSPSTQDWTRKLKCNVARAVRAAAGRTAC